MLTQYVDLSIRMGKREETMQFLVTGLGNEDLILGYPWLTTFEPQFNWTNGVIDTSYLPIVIRSLDWKSLKIRPTIAATLEEEPMTIIQQAHAYDVLGRESNVWANISMELAQKAGQYTKKVEVPPQYHQFTKVFDEEASHRLPQHQPWDHTIDLKPNAPSSLNCKIYPLTAQEKEAL